MLNATTDLLVEIGTEELPPITLPVLSTAFAAGVSRRLQEAGIRFSAVEQFAAPRRLALCVTGIDSRQPDLETLRRGPATTAAFGPDGTPTKAALGFARSCGVGLSELSREQTDKGEWLSFRAVSPGRTTAELVPLIVERALADLPISKWMRWGDGEAQFVRPVHWICLLLGSAPISGTVLGVVATASTWGHRFHHPQPIPLVHSSEYAEKLRSKGYVEPSYDRRRTAITAQLELIGSQTGLVPDIDVSLLDEVTALVEWPRAFLGSFDSEFLALPAEVLIETMRKNQKYFPVRDRSGALRPLFIGVSNIESSDPAQIRVGNERVIRARFSDAMFFWEQDLRQALEAYLPRLQDLIFHAELGSVADKCRRLASLSSALALELGKSPELAERAAWLSKCDLASAMVIEFPSLQGTIGRYYAEHCGERTEVSVAIQEHYLPRFAGDALPASIYGSIVALADRLDTLVGIFGIGQRPSGAKDPYGLRRASIALVRILIETRVSIDLERALDLAREAYGQRPISREVVRVVLGYVLDRLPAYYQECGIPADTVDAAVAIGVSTLSALNRRIHALQVFRGTPEGIALISANKRISNIVAKCDPSDIQSASEDLDALAEPAEVALLKAFIAVRDALEPLLLQGDFSAVLALIGTLNEPIDVFFRDVMVMTEEVRVRRSRLRLLLEIQRLFLAVGDFSRLQTEERFSASETGFTAK